MNPLIGCVAAVYLRGWLRRRSIPVWRACSFFLGLLATWVAVVTAWPMRWAPPNGLAKLLGNPAFCWLAAAAALVVWHVPAMLQLSMQSRTCHFIEHTSFLTTGLLFWWPVIEPWPSAARWPRWSILLYLFLATLPCDVLSGLLVFSDRVVYPMYLSMPRMSVLSPLEDQDGVDRRVL